jgi:hypothetical protein
MKITNLEAIAYHLEQGQDNGGLSKEALAAFLRSLIPTLETVQLDAERERCAKIAAEMDCQVPPGDYAVASPDLAGLISCCERQQCYHGDRIAEAIRAPTA